MYYLWYNLYPPRRIQLSECRVVPYGALDMLKVAAHFPYLFPGIYYLGYGGAPFLSLWAKAPLWSRARR